MAKNVDRNLILQRPMTPRIYTDLCFLWFKLCDEKRVAPRELLKTLLSFARTPSLPYTQFAVVQLFVLFLQRRPACLISLSLLSRTRPHTTFHPSLIEASCRQHCKYTTLDTSPKSEALSSNGLHVLVQCYFKSLNLKLKSKNLIGTKQFYGI